MDPSCHWSCWDEGIGKIGRGCGFKVVELEISNREKIEKRRRVIRDMGLKDFSGFPLLLLLLLQSFNGVLLSLFFVHSTFSLFY